MKSEENEIFERISFKDKKEWLNMRKKGIGGSDASAILGYNPYKSNVDVFEEKISCGVVQKEDTEFTIYGKKVEEPLRQIFKADYPNKLKVNLRNEILVRKDKDYLRASLDGEIIVKEDFEIPTFVRKANLPNTKKLKKGMRGIYEGKTVSRANNISVIDQWHNQVPQQYYIQILHYLLVTGYDFAVVNVLLKFNDNREIRQYVFMREEVKDDLEYLEKEEDKFWQNVLEEKKPSLIIVF